MVKMKEKERKTVDSGSFSLANKIEKLAIIIWCKKEIGWNLIKYC